MPAQSPDGAARIRAFARPRSGMLVQLIGLSPPVMITWWSKTYDALRDGECQIDDPTLEQLLAKKGVKPTPMEETVAEMLKT